MYDIAIIGAGQLGGRHLQAILKLTLPCAITVVDPADASLALAKVRASEVLHGAGHTIAFSRSIESLPAKLDYVIVATSADVRLGVIAALVAHCQTRFLLLEKILFQRTGDYATAAGLLTDANVTTWVDCARRAYPIYDEVKTFFATETIRSFHVTGGDWGLGCNAVHFLDLYAHLTGAVIGSIETAMLDEDIAPSRRAGFVEFTGMLAGRSSDAIFTATSITANRSGILIAIRSATRSCVIDEAGRTAFFADAPAGSWERRQFDLPLLSEISIDIARSVLTEGHCPLPGLAESTVIHLPLIEALADFAAQRAGTAPGYCPIT